MELAEEVKELLRETEKALKGSARRFGAPFRAAHDLLRAGTIGQLQRLEGTCDNLFDWGTHWFDIFGFYNDETPVT